MLHAIPNAAMRVRNPNKIPKHPRNSAAAARYANGAGTPEKRCRQHARGVLKDQKDGDRHQQDDQRPPPCFQVADAGVDADGDEEIHQQDITDVKIEGDLEASDEVNHPGCKCEEQAARDRLRDIRLAKARDAQIDRLAGKQHQDAGGHRKEGADENDAAGLQLDHRDAALTPITTSQWLAARCTTVSTSSDSMKRSATSASAAALIEDK